MLHLLLTRSKIIAGAEQNDEVDLLYFGDKPYLERTGQSPLKALDDFLGDLIQAYRETMGDQYLSPIPLAFALPNDANTAEKAQVRSKFKSLAQPASFSIVHEDNLATAYLLGHLYAKGEALAPAVVLDASEQHTNVCFFQPGSQPQGKELLKVNDPFVGEESEVFILKDFGPSAGQEKVLSEVLKSFTEAGLNVDFKGQTELAKQLEKARSPYIFQINQETRRVTIAGEMRLKDKEYQALITSNRERLGDHLNERNLKQRKVAHVVLLGGYLHLSENLSYLRDELKLAELLREGGMEDQDHTYEAMVMGLSLRAARVRELMRLRAAEEARRAKLEAEIKAKEGRESLLQRLQSICVDPARKEEYEHEFVPAGEELGIPEVVIKWNISEALNRIALEQEASKAGLSQAEKAKETPKAKTNGSANGHSGGSSNGDGKAEEKKPAGKSKEKPKVQPKPEPVLAHAEPQPAGGQPSKAAGPVAVAEPKTEEQADNKRGPSLNAIFLLENTIPGEEFPSRRASFKGDTVVKLVRLLPTEQAEDEAAVRRFERLHEKEVAYYGPLGEISEISEAKEGRYYFRDYLDRYTLKDYVQKAGLDKKRKVDDLSSEDLKFILQVFKSVQELEQPHNQLSEDHILVMNKRRGLFSRGGGPAEIRFVGFTSEEADMEKMVNDTHEAFTRLLGEQFYRDFRKQFQL